MSTNHMEIRSRMSTGDFSKATNTKVSFLRDLCNEGIFPPYEFGKQPQHRYWYYTPAQITAIKAYNVSSQIGIDRSVMKELSQDRSPQKVMQCFQLQYDDITAEIHALVRKQQIISTYMKLMEAGICATDGNISIRDLPALPIALGDKNDFSGSEDFHEAFLLFCDSPYSMGISRFLPVGGYFENMAAFRDSPSRPYAFFTVDPAGSDARPEGTYLVGYTRGYYGQTNGIEARMARFAEENRLEFCGPVYNIYVLDEISVSNPDEYLLEVSVPIKDMRI